MDATAPERFRIFFWQKAVPVLALAVFGLFFVLSPAARAWSMTVWAVVGGVAGAGVLLYAWNTWRQSDVTLDGKGLRVWIGPARETWPYRKLLKVKQIGKYRVRMCFDPDIPDKHMHITLDLFRSDDFVDALLDRYAETQGHELAEIESHEQAA